jgi:hypothetical protein
MPRPSDQALFPWGAVKYSTIALIALVGGVWVLNLPFAPLRWMVAKSAPVLLMPSFISMDQNYRHAIVNIEQADQLVNQATSPADFELGKIKANAAQKNLDALPVWFVGYYPSQYCSLFHCGWNFTIDEFRSARETAARMDAMLFQEDNARTQIEQADQTIAEAQQAYRQATDQPGQSKAIAQWQAAIDTLQEIPPKTLAGRMAHSKLNAYERDFQQVVGFTKDNTRTGSLITVAKQFAEEATQSAKNPPHSLAELEEIQKFWKTAIDRLSTITDKDPDYVAAQRQLVSYQKSLSGVQVQMKAEQDSVQAFDEAQRLKKNLLAVTTNDPQGIDRGRVASELQAIVDELAKVKPGTTQYSDAQKLMKSAQNRLK